MKDIILACDPGTQLYTIIEDGSKQLLPIYDKPMRYYPLSVLMLAGIQDILITTTSEDQAAFQRLLRNGSGFETRLQYAVRPESSVLAQTFIIAERLVSNVSV